MRKDRVQETRYGLSPFTLSMSQREDGLTLSNSPLMSRKRVDTFLLSIWGVLIALVRGLQASATDKPARDPHWWGLIRPVIRAMQVWRPFMIVSRIFEKVWNRTMMWKEEGES